MVSTVEDNTVHRYVSTYCLHGHCEECRLTCKFCEASCEHGCHIEGAAVRPSVTQHRYLSTSCWHDNHQHCQSEISIVGGPKIPGVCMWCAAQCICYCHRR